MRKISLLIIAVGIAASSPAIAKKAGYSVETSEIGILLSDPRSKAIIDKYLPGLTTASPQQQAGIRRSTLKHLQRLVPQQISDQQLANVQRDLARLPAR